MSNEVPTPNVDERSCVALGTTRTPRPHAFGKCTAAFTRHSTFGLRYFRRTATLVAFAACGIIVWQGSDRVPTGAAAGTSLASPSGRSALAFHGRAAATALRRDTLRVATFNIHGGRGTDGLRDLDRIASLLQDFDLVGLNEVHGARLGLATNQAAGLGKSLDRPWLFAPTERRWWRDDFGNGVLSTLPVNHWSRIPLTCSQGAGYRNAVRLAIPWQGRTVNVLLTHIDRQQDRELQLRTVFALFQSLNPPALLLGDFNTPATDPLLVELRAQSDARDATESSECGVASRGRIDWILTRGLTVVDSGCVSTTASDHPLFWTELRVDSHSISDEKKSNQ